MEAASPYNLIEIDRQALRHNYQVLQQFLGRGTQMLAVVKADAYGHGLLETATLLETEGARAFGVAEVREGVLLREAGIGGEIIILLGAKEDGLREVIRHRLQPVVFGVEQIRALSGAAARAGARVDVHLKVDLGMGRLGILPGELPFYLKLIAELPGLALVGILSHFPMADQGPDGETRGAMERFQQILAEAGRNFPELHCRHIANSAALLNFPESRLDLVRPGLALYGCFPDPRSAVHQWPDLRPAMRFTTKVLQVKEVPAGYGVSYGHTFVTTRPSRLAILPVGYADGYLRRLSNVGQVLVQGCRAPVCGTVCMNACIVDITDLTPVEPGEQVVLLGEQGGDRITAEEIAGWLQTISYEVLCLFGNNNARIYLN